MNVNNTFIRNVQIQVGQDGRVFIAAMDEMRRRSRKPARTSSTARRMAARPGTRPPRALRSQAPASRRAAYFATMFPSYWRHMGWGDVAAGPNGIVHYAYAQHGTGSDFGDVYYVRSTDNGVTWSTPMKLNTRRRNALTVAAVAFVSPADNILASWYDARNTSGNNFERFARLSTDNGATWGNDEVMSDAQSPLPSAARSERSALLHGRLRPQLQQRRGPLRVVGRRARPDQRRRPAGRLLRQADGRPTAAAATEPRARS